MLSGVTLLAIMLKLLTPFGYMPAEIGQGAPFKLCHTFWPVAPHMAHEAATAGHEKQGEHDSDDGAWSHCTFGALSTAVALAGEQVLPVVEVHGAVTVASTSNWLPARRSLAFHSRAPPCTTPISV